MWFDSNNTFKYIFICNVCVYCASRKQLQFYPILSSSRADFIGWFLAGRMLLYRTKYYYHEFYADLKIIFVSLKYFQQPIQLILSPEWTFYKDDPPRPRSIDIILQQ